MHLETAPHSILYNSPFGCFSAAWLEAQQYKQPFPWQQGCCFGRTVLMTAQQSWANSTHSSTPYRAVRKAGSVPREAPASRCLLCPGTSTCWEETYKSWLEQHQEETQGGVPLQTADKEAWSGSSLCGEHWPEAVLPESTEWWRTGNHLGSYVDHCSGVTWAHGHLTNVSSNKISLKHQLSGVMYP